MAFKIRGALKVLEIGKNQKSLDGFKVRASKDGQNLDDIASKLGLKLEANDKVLYFRCKMLGYDLPNGNGDAVPRVYASHFGPSFIGKILDVNHQTDPEHIIGKILTTFHVEAPLTLSAEDERIIGKNVLEGLEDVEANELQLEGICMIDRTTVLGDDIAKKLISGVLTMVSQEASTEYAECSVCSHRIDSPYSGICGHLDMGSLMVQAYAVPGKKHKVLAFKKHHGPVGTGLGVVTVGAYAKADVMDLVANLKSGKIKAEEAVAQLEIQERVYGRSPLLIQASTEVHQVCASLGVSPAVINALKKLDGVEALALMREFGKIKAEDGQALTELKTEVSSAPPAVKLDEGAAPTRDDADKSVSVTEVGNALGAPEVEPQDVEKLTEDAKKAAVAYEKDSDKEEPKVSAEPPKVEAKIKGVQLEENEKALKAAKQKINQAGREEALEYSEYVAANAGDRIGWLAQYLGLDMDDDRSLAFVDALKAKLEGMVGEPAVQASIKASESYTVGEYDGEGSGDWAVLSQPSNTWIFPAGEETKATREQAQAKCDELNKGIKAAAAKFPIRLTNGKWRDQNGNSYETFEEALRAQASLGGSDDETEVEHEMVELGKKWKGPHGGHPQYLPMSHRWKDANGNSYDTYEEAEEASVSISAVKNDTHTVIATFFRKPDLAASYWMVADKDEKVLGRFTLGAIAHGNLNRKVKFEGKQVDLSTHLQSPAYGQDLVKHVLAFGAKKVLGTLAAAEKTALKAGGGAGIRLKGFEIADSGQGTVQPDGSIKWTKLPILEKFDAEGYQDGMSGVRGSILEVADVQPKARPEPELKAGDVVSLYKMDFEYVWMGGWVRSAPEVGDTLEITDDKAIGNGELVFLVESPEGAYDAYTDVGSVQLKVTDEFANFYEDVFNSIPDEADAEMHYEDARHSWSASIKADPTEAIEQCLANDEASSDDELIQHFVTEMKIPQEEAEAWVARRGEYLTGHEKLDAPRDMTPPLTAVPVVDSPGLNQASLKVKSAPSELGQAYMESDEDEPFVFQVVDKGTGKAMSQRYPKAWEEAKKGMSNDMWSGFMKQPVCIVQYEGFAPEDLSMVSEAYVDGCEKTDTFTASIKAIGNEGVPGYEPKEEEAEGAHSLEDVDEAVSPGDYEDEAGSHDVQEVAGWWHGGQFTELYKLSSSGTVDSIDGLVAEINSNIKYGEDNKAIDPERKEATAELNFLLDWAEALRGTSVTASMSKPFTQDDFSKYDEKAKGMTDAELLYSIDDCSKAGKAARGHDSVGEGRYSDEAAAYMKEMNTRRGGVKATKVFAALYPDNTEVHVGDIVTFMDPEFGEVEGKVKSIGGGDNGALTLVQKANGQGRAGVVFPEDVIEHRSVVTAAFDEPEPEDSEGFGPQEEDITIGEDDLSAYYTGREIVSVTREEADEDPDALYKEIKRWTEKNNYSPDVWWISDHGNSNNVSEAVYAVDSAPKPIEVEETEEIEASDRRFNVVRGKQILAGPFDTAREARAMKASMTAAGSK